MCAALIESCTVNVKPGFIKEDKQSTEQEIEKFHSRFNAEDYELIYNKSIPELQKSIYKADMLKLMKNEHDEAGNFKSVIDKRINVIVGAPVQIRAGYISQYSKMDLTEMFLFVKDGEEIKLALYKPSKGRTELPDIGK